MTRIFVIFLPLPNHLERRPCLTILDHLALYRSSSILPQLTNVNRRPQNSLRELSNAEAKIDRRPLHRFLELPAKV